MLVTLLIIVALLAGAAVLVGLQRASTRSTDLSRSGTSSLYCAEGGLAAARPIVVANYGRWKDALDGTDVTWVDTEIDAVMGGHDLDGDAAGPDFEIRLYDNHDESGVSDPTVDKDLKIFISSKCLRYTETQKEVRELVEYNGIAPCYPWQAGGCAGAGNNN